MLIFIMLNVVLLNFTNNPFMLSVIMLSVVAPADNTQQNDTLRTAT